VFPIHHDQQRLVPKRILDPPTEMHHQQTAEYILVEIHEGICGNHSGARTMAAKVLRAGYYWPTVQGDCAEYVKKCVKSQEFDPLHHRRTEELHSIIFPWSFTI